MTGFHSKRMLNGKGKLHGPDPYAQFKRVVELIHGCLPLFAESVLLDGIMDRPLDKEMTCPFHHSLKAQP